MRSLLAITTAALIAAFSLFVPGRLMAEIITISFEAEVNEIFDPGGCFNGGVNVGDWVTGTYSYDSEFWFNEMIPAGMRYVFINSEGDGLGINVNFRDFFTQNDPLAAEALTIVIGNDINGSVDQYWVKSIYNIPLANGTDVKRIQLTLRDDSGEAIDSEHLPLTAPELEKWPHRYFNVEAECGGIEGSFLSTVTTMGKVYPLNVLVEELKGLTGNGAFSHEQELGLYTRLASAATKFEADMLPQACYQLQAFICQLNALMPQVSEEFEDQVDRILDDAEKIFEDRCEDEGIEVMGCPENSGP